MITAAAINPKKIIKEAKNLGYQVFEFNIEADIEITLERFRKRKSEKKEKDISCLFN